MLNPVNQLIDFLGQAGAIERAYVTREFLKKEDAFGSGRELTGRMIGHGPTQ